MKPFRPFKTIIRNDVDKQILCALLGVKPLATPIKNLIIYDIAFGLLSTTNFDEYASANCEEIDYKTLFAELEKHHKSNNFGLIKRFPLPNEAIESNTLSFNIFLKTESDAIKFANLLKIKGDNYNSWNFIVVNNDEVIIFNTAHDMDYHFPNVVNYNLSHLESNIKNRNEPLPNFSIKYCQKIVVPFKIHIQNDNDARKLYWMFGVEIPHKIEPFHFFDGFKFSSSRFRPRWKNDTYHKELTIDEIEKMVKNIERPNNYFPKFEVQKEKITHTMKPFNTIDFTKPFKVLCLNQNALCIVGHAVNIVFESIKIDETNKMVYFDGKKVHRISEKEAEKLVDVPLVFLSDIQKTINKLLSDKQKIGCFKMIVDNNEQYEFLRKHRIINFIDINANLFLFYDGDVFTSIPRHMYLNLTEIKSINYDYFKQNIEPFMRQSKAISMKPFKTIVHDANTKKQICEMLQCDLRNFNKLLHFDGEKLHTTNDFLEYDNIQVDELDANDVLNHLRKLKNQQSESKTIIESEQEKIQDALKEHNPTNYNLKDFKIFLSNKARIDKFKNLLRIDASEPLNKCIIFEQPNRIIVIGDSLDELRKSQPKYLTPLSELIEKIYTQNIIRPKFEIIYKYKVSDICYQKAAEKYVDRCLFEIIKNSHSSKHIITFTKNLKKLHSSVLYEYIESYLENKFKNLACVSVIETKAKHPNFTVQKHNTKKIAEILFEKYGNSKIVRNNSKIIKVTQKNIIVSFFGVLLTLPRTVENITHIDYRDYEKICELQPNYKLINKDDAISALTNELKNLSKKFDDFAQSFK